VVEVDKIAIDKLFRNSFFNVWPASKVNWLVSENYLQPLYAYLVYGLDPGGLLSNILANDAAAAAAGNSAVDTRGHELWILWTLMRWLAMRAPPDSWGSYDKLDKWMALTNNARRAELIYVGLLPGTFDLIKDPNRGSLWD
jgi:hypothetical protein